MTPSDIFKFGINYGVALHRLFLLKSFIMSLGGVCEGVRVLTPAGWQNRVRETPADVFEFGGRGPKKTYSERKEEWFQLALKLCAETGGAPGMPIYKYAADSYLISRAGFVCAGVNKDKSAILYKTESDYYDNN